MNDVIINKAQSIQRCVKRAREEYEQAENFHTDYTRQDAAILNVLCACELSIDLTRMYVRSNRLHAK